VTVTISHDSLGTAGILLLSILSIEFLGTLMLRVVLGGVPATGFQTTFFRAGHAHAGVLIILGLVCTLLVDFTSLSGIAEWVARAGVPAGAILMSSGYFLSALGTGRTRPNRMIVILWLGATCVAAGVATLGVGLLRAA
jgi:hypothetical protein